MNTEDVLDPPSLGLTSPVTARFRLLVTRLVGPAAGDELQLNSYRDGEAQLCLTRPGKKPVFLVLVNAAKEDERSLRLRLARLASESVADQSVVFVANHGWMAEALKKAAKEFYPRIQLFQLSSDGVLEYKHGTPPPPLRAALAAQKEARPSVTQLESEADFAKRCTQAEEERQRLIEAFSDEFKRRPAPVTLSLLGLGLVLFVLERVFAQGGDHATTLVQLGAKVPVFIRGGEWWRLFSALPLHSDPIAALVNSLVLLSLGLVLEKLLGSARFLILYVGAGLLGSLVGSFGPAGLQAVVGVGSTGTLFGLLSAAAALALRPIGLPTAMATRLLRLGLMNLAFNIFLSLLPELGRLLRLGFIATLPGMDRLAHLGGLIGGAVLILSGALRPLRIGDQPDPKRPGRIHAAIAALLGLLLAASVALALVKGRPWSPDRSWRERLGKSALQEARGQQPGGAPGTGATGGTAAPREFSEEDLKLVRRALGDSGLSVEVPALLGKPSEKLGDGRASIYELGDLASDLQVLSIGIAPRKQALKKAKLRPEFDRGANQLKAEKNKEIESGELRLTAPPSDEDVGGWPTLQMSFQGKEGTHARALFQQRPRYSISIWYVHADVLSESTAVDLKRLLASLQDGAAPTAKSGATKPAKAPAAKKRRR
jgi:membrane associated rhomboid family serine protease